MSVLIITSVGDIVVDLHADQCPLTTKNFLKLCKMKYYDGCLFHKMRRISWRRTGTGCDFVYKYDMVFDRDLKDGRGTEGKERRKRRKEDHQRHLKESIEMAVGDEHKTSSFFFKFNVLL